mgnify:CR=1 FL=1
MKKRLTVVAAIITVVALVLALLGWAASQGNGPLSKTGDGAHGKDSPNQPDWCPAVEFIAAPGTGESAPTDDPFNPTFNQNAYLRMVTEPLKKEYDSTQARVWTLPYAAQIANRNTPDQKTYDDSRNGGTDRLIAEMRYIDQTCPLSKFILVGFSQGAAIVGDVANSVGTNQGPVAADKILGVVPLADPRRENGVGQHPGLPLQGTGAEIALRQVQPVVDLAAPGVSLRGPRQGGFGSLNERVFEICAPDDVVCDTPVDLMAAFARLQQILSNPEVHGQYGTNPNSVPGTTAGAWILDWSKKLIDGAK